MSDSKRLEEKLDKMDDRLDSIDKTLAVNTVLLDEHIKRTNILEKEFKPVKNHVVFVNNLAKAVAALGSAAVVLHELGIF